MTPILILAAGRSSRMGDKDKLLELVGGIPLLRKIASSAIATGRPVFVAIPSADHPRRAAIADLDLEVMVIPEAAEGMSGTMRGAVALLPGTGHFLLVLGDLAQIGTAEMNAVLSGPSTAPDALIWRGATEDGRPGHPILFDGSLRPRFADLSGDGGGEPLVRPLVSRTFLVPLPGQVARRDLDTPEDWARFRAETGL